jgi:hypothetical protein
MIPPYLYHLSGLHRLFKSTPYSVPPPTHTVRLDPHPPTPLCSRPPTCTTPRLSLMSHLHSLFESNPSSVLTLSSSCAALLSLAMSACQQQQQQQDQQQERVCGGIGTHRQVCSNKSGVS